MRGLLNDLKEGDPATREQDETEWGWAYNPLGVMGDLAAFPLKPVTQTMLCWMHTFLTDGTWNLEMFFLLIVLRRFIDIGDFVAFMSKAVFPKQLGNAAAFHCTAEEIQKMFNTGDHFKCSASEGLSLYPLVAIFLQVFVVPRGVCQAQIASYMAMARVLDLLSLSRFGLVTPEQLAIAIRQHMTLFVAAYDTFGVKPKFHYELHFPELLKRHGTLLGSENERIGMQSTKMQLI